MASDRELRASARASWPGGVLSRSTPAQLSTPEARLASMWQLALDAWALRGEAVPPRDRSDLPGRVIRRP